MLDKVIKAVKEYNMLLAGDTVTVALSGGADSVALLNALYTLSGELGITVKAAHFNHKIRGAEAERDCEFCKRLCESKGIELTIGSADVLSYAKDNSLSVELAARKLRYEFFASLKTTEIATAHTASDNLETVLFNLTRGTALKGLCGIPPVRDNFIRPLIFCTRAEIEEYCNKNGLDFVTDSTNLTDDCTRNILRHKIIPVLKEINPSVERSALNTSIALRLDDNALNYAANAYYENNISGQKLCVSDFSELEKAVALRVISRFFSENGISADSFHINSIYSLCISGGKLSVPAGKTAVSDKKTLYITDLSIKKEFNVDLEIKDIDFFNSSQKINNLFLKNLFDCDKIDGDLVIRTRKTGDKINLAGKMGTKSFKKLYNEYKIPLDMRENLPVIADSSGPVWVYKIGVAKRCAADKDTKRVYFVKVT